jgi:hypothetical protein
VPEPGPNGQASATSQATTSEGATHS